MPTAFTTAITDATAAVTEGGGALIAVTAAGVLFFLGVKFIKKIVGAA